MARYCAPEDLEISAEDLAELTTETGEDYDPAVIDRAIAKATTRIEAYCSGRYQVPF
ncbi:MAG: DUF1320 family protein, partial [Deltaproteobacteria bacterium]|nr:DUF1320 family protein [Deltaproteobacteria bacterium]